MGKRLTAALFPLDKLRGLRPNEKVDGSTQDQEADPIDLDTPTWPEEALDDRDLHDLRLQEEDARAEEEGLLRMVEEYEEQQKASAAKREDDKAMEAALNAPRIKQPRLQIDVQVTSGSSSSSSTRVHIPLNDANNTAVIAIKLRKVDAIVANDTVLDTDDANLMQQGSTTSTTSSLGLIDQDTLHNIRILLNMMNDRSRGQLLRQVRHEIHRRLVNHVLRAQHLQGIINGGLFGDAATSSSMSFCPTTDTIVNLIMDNIDTNEDMVANATVDGAEMVAQLLEIMNSGDSSCGAEAGSARPCLPLANLDATQIAEYMRAHPCSASWMGKLKTGNRRSAKR